MSPPAKLSWPLHCASYCFLNSPAYISLVGAQFPQPRHRRLPYHACRARPSAHAGATAASQAGTRTYVHTKHNDKDRTVLEYRVGRRRQGAVDLGSHRTGKGRVFYTALGHDGRTWGHPGFQEPRRARHPLGRCRSDISGVPTYVDQPEMTKLAKDLPAVQVHRGGRRCRSIPPASAGGTMGKPITKIAVCPSRRGNRCATWSTPADFRGLKLFADEKLLGGQADLHDLGRARDRFGGRRSRWTIPTSAQAEGGKAAIGSSVVEDTDGDGVADKVNRLRGSVEYSYLDCLL